MEQGDVATRGNLVAVDLVDALVVALAGAHRAARLGGSLDAVAGGDYPVGVDGGAGADAVVGVGVVDTHGDHGLGLVGIAGEGGAFHRPCGLGDEGACDGEASYVLFHDCSPSLPR